MDWVLTIFSKPLQLDLVIRLWDNLFFEGETFLWRTCLALLFVHSDTILNSKYDECMRFLTHLPEVEEDVFFDAISVMTVSTRRLQRIVNSVR